MTTIFTKDEVVALVDRHIHRRFGRRFTTLDDLIKDNLAPRTTRVGHDGRKPIYGYGWRDLHRILFLATLQAHGVRGRDAMRLRLFVAGCKLPISEVRSALLGEYRKTVAKLSAQTRTAYFDNRKALTAAKRESIAHEVGHADEVLRRAGLEIPLDPLLTLARTARQDPLSKTPLSLSPQFIADLLAGRTTMTAVAEALAPAFSGLMLLGEDAHDQSDGVDSIESLIRNSTDDDLLQAKDLLRAMARLMALSGALGLSTNSDLLTAAAAVARTIKRSPQFLPYCLVLSLRLIAEPPKFPPVIINEVERWFRENPDALAKMLASNSTLELTIELSRNLQGVREKKDSRASKVD